MSTAAASDPFESTANPAHYVARPACEQLLATLEQRVRQGTHPVAVTGPAGFGKTFLLNVLGERLRGTFRVVGLPYPALSGAELCHWVLDALGAGTGEDPEGSLLDFAFRTASEHGEILILVDDASALPPGTARSLATLVSASGGALRAVFAAVDDARLGPAIAALGPDLQEIRFETPMTVEETAAYLNGRLAEAADPVRAARFDDDTIARLHGATGGIPRRVHELGSLVWRLDQADGIPYVIERWAREDAGREDEPADERLETNGSAAADAADAAGEAAVLAAAAALEPPEAEPATSTAPAPAASAPAPTRDTGDEQLPDLDLLPPEELEPEPARRPPAPLEREPDRLPPQELEPAPDPLPPPNLEPEADLLPPAEPEPPPPAPPHERPPEPVHAGSGRSRTRSVWAAVFLLAAVAMAMPYLMDAIEGLLPGEPPARPRVRVGPAAVAPAPDEGFAAVEQPVPPRPDPESPALTDPQPPDDPMAAKTPELEPAAIAAPEPAPAREPVAVRTPEPAPEPIAVRTPKPAPEPIVVRTPEPAPEPIVVRTPEPAPEPVAVRAPEPAPEPIAVRTPEPAPEPIAVRTPEPAPEPIAARTPEPRPEPVAVRTPEPAPEPIAARTPEPRPEPVAVRSPEPAPEPAAIVAPEPVAVVAPAPAPVATPEPVAAATPEPVAVVPPQPPREPVARPEPVRKAPAPAPRARGPAPVMVNVHAIPWATIHVDGGVIGETPLVGVPLSPGLHVFRAEFPGGRAVVRTIEISSENRHVSFE